MIKKIIFSILALTLGLSLNAQSLKKAEGSCGENAKWIFDGYTLTIFNDNTKGFVAEIGDYDLKNMAPWAKKNLDVRRIDIQPGVTKIGSCAFANLPNLQEVIFNSIDVNYIGWGAFMNCPTLRTISIPVNVRNIETVAFANCTGLSAIKIPDQCRVADKAFLSCKNLKSVDLSPTTILGQYVFATEEKVGDKVKRTYYNGDLIRVPSYINENNCNEYGLSKASVTRIGGTSGEKAVDYDYQTSDIDSNIPQGMFTRNDTYALIIGNQNYRFVSDVPYAIHDARIFADYCNKTLGIPSSNIHLSEDATKQMILEEEMMDWMNSIPDRENKRLIVYYAGHGVPDVKNKNKAYLLPTDVRGTSPHRGIALEDFYAELGKMDFANTTVFLDACFSGINRDNEGVTEGLRGVEIEAEDAELADNSSLVVFSAAQGNETAQGYPEHGHGLFTYYLLKALNDTKGSITYGNLSDYLKENVSRTALQLKMRKAQSPSSTASERYGEKWRYMSL